MVCFVPLPKPAPCACAWGAFHSSAPILLTSPPAHAQTHGPHFRHPPGQRANGDRRARAKRIIKEQPIREPDRWTLSTRSEKCHERETRRDAGKLREHHRCRWLVVNVRRDSGRAPRLEQPPQNETRDCTPAAPAKRTVSGHVQADARGPPPCTRVLHNTFYQTRVVRPEPRVVIKRHYVNRYQFNLAHVRLSRRCARLGCVGQSGQKRQRLKRAHTERTCRMRPRR